MRRADGIHAERFQGLQPFFPDPQRHRRAERPAVRVQTHALDLEIFVVQPETGVGVEMKFPDAKGRGLLIQDFFAVTDLADGAI